MGNNEKGMRHDNSKILSFGLLALAALLVLKGKKVPGVGKLNPIEQENKRIKRNKRLYKELSADSNYTVKFDERNGGLKATHKDHNFDKDKGVYEKNVQEAGYKAGCSVVLASEKDKELNERFTEGFWDGVDFEIAGNETGTSGNILRGLKHCASKIETEIAVLYFPIGVFDRDKLERAIGRYKGLEKLNDGQFLFFQKIICVEDKEIVYITDLS